MHGNEPGPCEPTRIRTQRRDAGRDGKDTCECHHGRGEDDGRVRRKSGDERSHARPTSLFVAIGIRKEIKGNRWFARLCTSPFNVCYVVYRKPTSQPCPSPPQITMEHFALDGGGISRLKPTRIPGAWRFHLSRGVRSSL